MAEIYAQWAAAHGIMIICPVNWYQAPSSLKLMNDRLVCADGGNPDPTSTGGKNPQLAKELELKGWYYPRHLAGRVFSVVVHGDATMGLFLPVTAPWLEVTLDIMSHTRTVTMNWTKKKDFKKKSRTLHEASYRP